MAPYIPIEERSRYGIGEPAGGCEYCGKERIVIYCRQCDEFDRRCLCPDAHTGHRVYTGREDD